METEYMLVKIFYNIDFPNQQLEEIQKNMKNSRVKVGLEHCSHAWESGVYPLFSSNLRYVYCVSC